MSWVPKICNKLRKDLTEKTRYGRYDVLHVSDALDCQVKMYLDRVLASSQSCASLARMKQGRMWEHYVKDIFEAENYVFEKVLRGDMVYEFQGKRLRDIDLIATPDFTNLDKKYVVELKTTRWTLEEVQLITRHILDTLKALDTPLPEYDVEKYPIFPSAIAAVCAYRGGLPKKGRPVLGETKLIYIYRDTLQEYDIPRSLVDLYNAWFLERRVPIGIWTLYKVKEIFGPERRIPHMSFDLNVVKKLYRYELHSEGLYNYFKCATCAYRGDPCPSLPSLTVPDFADLDLMEKMLAKLRDYGMISLSAYESLATRLNVLRRTRMDAEWERRKMGDVKSQLIKFILALRRAVKPFDEELPVVKKVVWSDPFVLEREEGEWVEKPLELVSKTEDLLRKLEERLDKLEKEVLGGGFMGEKTIEDIVDELGFIKEAFLRDRVLRPLRTVVDEVEKTMKRIDWLIEQLKK